MIFPAPSNFGFIAFNGVGRIFGPPVTGLTDSEATDCDVTYLARYRQIDEGTRGAFRCYVRPLITKISTTPPTRRAGLLAVGSLRGLFSLTSCSAVTTMPVGANVLTTGTADPQTANRTVFPHIGCETQASTRC